MMHGAVETEAIVLRRFDYSESSQVAHLFTLHDGRVSGLAKGIKRPNASLKGPMDLFFRAHVTYRRRRGTSLHLLTRYEPITAHRRLRTRLERLYAAFYVAELVYDGTREDDPNPELYAGLVASLEALSGASSAAVPAVVAATELVYLASTGLMPLIDACVRCGREAPPGPVSFFPLDGGVICRRCRTTPGRPLRRSHRLDGALRAILSGIVRGGIAQAVRTRLSARQHAALRQVMRELVHGALERPLSSEPFLADPTVGFRRDARLAYVRRP